MKRTVLFFKNFPQDIQSVYLERIFNIFGDANIYRIVDREGNFSGSGFVELDFKNDDTQNIQNDDEKENKLSLKFIHDIINHLSYFGVEIISDLPTGNKELNQNTLRKIEDIFKEYDDFKNDFQTCDSYVNYFINNNYSSYDVIDTMWDDEQKLIQKKYLRLKEKYDECKEEVEVNYEKLIDKYKR